MIHLPGVLAAAGEVQHFCQQQGWRSCLIGVVAVQRWGEPESLDKLDRKLAMVERRLRANL